MTDALDKLPDMLRAVAPNAPAMWSAALAAPMRSSGMTTPRRAAMALGMFAEETGGFTAMVENLNYSADALTSLFGRHFPNGDESDYARNPERIAKRIYADRMGNGTEASGDGWKFRGRGIIQLTGRDLYTRFAKAAGITLDSTPDYLETPAGAAASACWYWTLPRSPNLLALSDVWDIRSVTRIVNGGLINLDRRVTLCNAALAVFGG